MEINKSLSRVGDAIFIHTTQLSALCLNYYNMSLRIMISAI